MSPHVEDIVERIHEAEAELVHAVDAQRRRWHYRVQHGRVWFDQEVCRAHRRLVIFSLAMVPSYVLFALCSMVVSPLATRLVGWRTPRDVEMRIADMEWPLLRWARYMASIHVVRVVAGTLFRGHPSGRLTCA